MLEFILKISPFHLRQSDNIDNIDRHEVFKFELIMAK